jgi:hypothetical protein
MKTVKLIVADWLKANGFDGLCNPDAGCGCLIGDLAPCGEMSQHCLSGKRVAYSAGACPCGEGCAWHVEVPEYLPLDSGAPSGQSLHSVNPGT